MALRQTSTLAVVAGVNTITLPIPMGSANYALDYRLIDGVTFEAVGATVTSRIASAFVIDCVSAGNLTYTAIEYGASLMGVIQSGTASVVPGGTDITFDNVMPTDTYVLSFRCYNALGEGIGCDVAPALQTAGGFHAVPLEASTLEYIAFSDSLGVGISTLTTERLSRDWTVQRLWAEAVRDTQLDQSQVDHFERFNLITRAIQTVAGLLYPLLSSAYLTEQSVTVSGNKLTVADLYLGVGGPEPKINLESTLTDFVVPMGRDEFAGFRESSHQHSESIAWSYANGTLYLKRGTGLASYGTLTLFYPRIPAKPTADTEKIDLPDGVAMEIALVHLKRILADRYGLKEKPEQSEALRLIDGLFSKAPVQVALEEVKGKAEKVL